MSLKIYLLPFFFFPIFATAQTDFSFTIGGNLSMITPTPASEVRGYYYFVSDEKQSKLGTTVGIKVQRKINKQFNFDYQLRLFNHVGIMGCDDRGELHVCGGWGPYLRQDGKVDYYGAIHSLSFNFRLQENFYVGIGGYYQTTRFDVEKGKYLSIYRIADYFIYHELATRQAGCLGTISYTHKKWTLETRYLKGIGDVFKHHKYPLYLKSTDGIELSLSYRFLSKEKKKKNKSKSK